MKKVFLLFFLICVFTSFAQKLKTKKLPENLFQANVSLNINFINDPSGQKFKDRSRALEEEFLKRGIELTASFNTYAIANEMAFDLESETYRRYRNFKNAHGITIDVSYTEVSLSGVLNYFLVFSKYDSLKPKTKQPYFSIKGTSKEKMFIKLDKAIKKQFKGIDIQPVAKDTCNMDIYTSLYYDNLTTEVINTYPEDLSKAVLLIVGYHEYEIDDAMPESQKVEYRKYNASSPQKIEDKREMYSCYPYTFKVINQNEIYEYMQKESDSVYYLLDNYFYVFDRLDKGSFIEQIGPLTFDTTDTVVRTSLSQFYIRDLRENKVYVEMDEIVGVKSSIQAFCESVKE